MEIPLTLSCNNNCISCIRDRSLPSGHIPWKRIKQKIDDLPKSCDTVGITGGEPTISPEFFRTMSYIRDTRPDTLLFLVSNGRMFSYPGFARKFSNLYIRNLRVGIAIYSHEPDVHDSVTMAKGSWEQAIKGIKNLTKMGIRVELRIIVNSLNYTFLDETASFITGNLSGVERVVFINMKYSGNALRNRKRIFIGYGRLTLHIARAADTLLEAGIHVKLFHFPLCVLPEKYREIAKGVTKQKSELAFANACDSCSSRHECPMIWKTYLNLAGDKEFKPIKKKSS